MNKTHHIGLAGFSFIVEDHAYIKLQDYLTALRRSLDADEADEVMHDIEIRIVEILKDILGKREVVNDGDIEKVIQQIGRPEVIEEQEEAYYSETQGSRKKNNAYSGPRQLFRDPERAKLGGVCAGLAHYFGLDMTLMRVLWVVFALTGVFTAAISTTLIFFLYLILWIVLPKARTASDFLKMKGKPANFDNLKEESNKIVQFTNEAGQKVGEMYQESKPFINKAGSGFWNIMKVILGVFFLFLAIGALIGSFAIFGFAGDTNINFFGNVGFYLKDSNLAFVPIAFAFLSAFIPALVFTFLAIRLLSPRTKLNYLGYVFGGLAITWLALLGIIGYIAIKHNNMYSGQNEETQNIAIATTSDSILIDTKKVEIPANFKSYWDDIYSDGKLIYKQDRPDIHVKREDVAAPYLIVEKEADGYNQPLNTRVPVEVVDNKIMLPNYFSYPYEHRFRNYRVNYQLVVPKEMKVISLKENSIYLDDYDKEEEENTNGVDSLVINKSGKSIKFSSDLKDSIIINGQKYPEADAERIMDSLDLNWKDLGNIDISIKDGKKEISIKTK